MLTVGGNLNNNVTKGCDWETKGVAIMDMSSKTWGSVYDAYAAPYEVTQDIVDVIGGSTRGGSTLKAPKDGFSDPAVSALFARPKATKTPSSSGAAKPSSTAKAKKSHAGAIAGAVLGVLILLGLLAGAALFFLHRMKKQRQQNARAMPMDTMEHTEGGYLHDGNKVELAGHGLPVNSASELPAAVAPVQYHELPNNEKGAELHGDSVVSSQPVTPASQERLLHTPSPMQRN